jgi:hypothetical protein
VQLSGNHLDRRKGLLHRAPLPGQVEHPPEGGFCESAWCFAPKTREAPMLDYFKNRFRIPPKGWGKSTGRQVF